MSEISDKRRRRIKSAFYSILISTSKKSRKSCTLSKNNFTINNILNVKTLFLLFYQNYQDKNSCIKNEQHFDKLTVMSTAKVTE